MIDSLTKTIDPVNFIVILYQFGRQASVPHLIVEYSGNIEDQMDLAGLLDKLHEAASESGIFPLGGLRTRAERRNHYRIADCHPDNGFVHVTAMVGHGRELGVRRRVGEDLFRVICKHLGPLYEQIPLGISFNIKEFHSELNFKKNNLHEYVKTRNKVNHRT